MYAETPAALGLLVPAYPHAGYGSRVRRKLKRPHEIGASGAGDTLPTGAGVGHATSDDKTHRTAGGRNLIEEDLGHNVCIKVYTRADRSISSSSPR